MKVTSALPQPQKREWTLLFYNAGSNDEDMMCTSNLLDLERVGSDENTHVVCLNHHSGWLGRAPEMKGARTYYVEKQGDAAERGLKELALSTPTAIRSPELNRLPEGTNLGDPAVLKKFLLENMRRFPAEHYALVVSGHGAGFAGQAIVHNPEGRITNEQLGDTLREVAQATGRPLDVVNLNTCYGAGLEVLRPLVGGAENAVASQGVVWGPTQPFGTVLQELQGDLKAGKDVDGAELARKFVTASHAQPLASMATGTMSAFRLDGMARVEDAVKGLHEAVLSQAIPPATVRDALKESLRFDYSGIPRLIHVTDLASFAGKLAEKAPTLKESAQKVIDALGDCRIAEQHEAPENDSLTTRLLRFPLRRPEENQTGLGGLTLHYDDDVNQPGNRLPRLQGTQLAESLQSEKFFHYVSQANDADRAARPAWKKAQEAVNLQLAAWENKVDKAIGIPYAVPLAKKVGSMGAALGASALLGHLGVPVAEIYGVYFAGLGAWQMGEQVKKVASLDELDRAGKQQLVESAGQLAIGAGLGAFGLSMAGVLPPGVMWPAIGVCLAGRATKLAGKLFV